MFKAHELYTIAFDGETLRQLSVDGSVFIPNATISSAVFDGGEKFHPRILGALPDGSYSIESFDI